MAVMTSHFNKLFPNNKLISYLWSNDPRYLYPTLWPVMACKGSYNSTVGLPRKAKMSHLWPDGFRRPMPANVLTCTDNKRTTTT